MSGLRTLDDMIRHRMTVEGAKRLHVVLRDDGRFEAAVVHRDGRTATCEVSADPTDALWNTLAPYPMRRRLPSGREVAADEADEIDLLADLEDTELDLLT